MYPVCKDWKLRTGLQFRHVRSPLNLSKFHGHDPRLRKVCREKWNRRNKFKQRHEPRLVRGCSSEELEYAGTAIFYDGSRRPLGRLFGCGGSGRGQRVSSSQSYRCSDMGTRHDLVFQRNAASDGSTDERLVERRLRGACDAGQTTRWTSQYLQCEKGHWLESDVTPCPRRVPYEATCENEDAASPFPFILDAPHGEYGRHRGTLPMLVRSGSFPLAGDLCRAEEQKTTAGFDGGSCRRSSFHERLGINGASSAASEQARPCDVCRLSQVASAPPMYHCYSLAEQLDFLWAQQETTRPIARQPRDDRVGGEALYKLSGLLLEGRPNLPFVSASGSANVPNNPGGLDRICRSVPNQYALYPHSCGNVGCSGALFDGSNAPGPRHSQSCGDTPPRRRSTCRCIDAGATLRPWDRCPRRHMREQPLDQAPVTVKGRAVASQLRCERVSGAYDGFSGVNDCKCDRVANVSATRTLPCYDQRSVKTLIPPQWLVNDRLIVPQKAVCGQLTDVRHAHRRSLLARRSLSECLSTHLPPLANRRWKCADPRARRMHSRSDDFLVATMRSVMPPVLLQPRPAMRLFSTTSADSFKCPESLVSSGSHGFARSSCSEADACRRFARNKPRRRRKFHNRGRRRGFAGGNCNRGSDECQTPSDDTDGYGGYRVAKCAVIKQRYPSGRTGNNKSAGRLRYRAVGSNSDDNETAEGNRGPAVAADDRVTQAPSVRSPPTCAVDESDDEDSVPIKSPSGRFIRLEEIGRGAFKTVYKGLDSADGVAVAWCELQDVYNRAERMRFREEVKLLKELQHPNIVRFFDHWVYHYQNRRIIVLVTELMTSGSLKTYLRNFKSELNPKKLKIIKSWCRQILQGLAYMHSRKPPVIHRDLKCDNIFISGTTGSVKIGDLGLAVFKTETFAKSMRGTVEFMAPEMFEERYDEMVDVYSFGLCMLELVTGEYPYIECRFPTALMRKIINGLRPDCYYKVKVECVREIIDCCIRRNKNERLSAKELLKHSFFMESNGLVMETVHPNNRRATLADRIVEFKLKIEDASKRIHSLGQSDALAFKFDVQLDNPEKICAELLDKKLIFEDDVAFVAQSIRDKLRALNYEQLDELQKISPAMRSLDKPDLFTVNNKVNASASTSPCLVPNGAMKLPDMLQSLSVANDDDREGAVDVITNSELTVSHQDDLSNEARQRIDGQFELAKSVADASTQNQLDRASKLAVEGTVDTTGSATTACIHNTAVNLSSMPSTLRFHPCAALNIQEAALIAANVASNRFTVVPHSVKTGELEFTSGDRSDDQVYGMQSIKLSQIKRVQITVISIERNQVKCLFEIPGVFIEFLFDRARFKPEIVGSVLSSMIVKRSTKEDIDQYKIPLTMSCIECLTNIVKSIEPSIHGEKTVISGGNVFTSDVRQNNNIENLNADELVDSIKRTPSSYKQSFVVSKMNVDKNMIGTPPANASGSNGSNHVRSKEFATVLRDRASHTPSAATMTSTASENVTSAHVSSGGALPLAIKPVEQTAPKTTGNAPDSTGFDDNKLLPAPARQQRVRPQTPTSPPLAGGSPCSPATCGCVSVKPDCHPEQGNADDARENSTQQVAVTSAGTGVPSDDNQGQQQLLLLVTMSGPTQTSQSQPCFPNAEQPLSLVASDQCAQYAGTTQGRPAPKTPEFGSGVANSPLPNAETGSRASCLGTGSNDKATGPTEPRPESNSVATGVNAGRSDNGVVTTPQRVNRPSGAASPSARASPQQSKTLPPQIAGGSLEGATTDHAPDSSGQATAVKKAHKAAPASEESKMNCGGNGREPPTSVQPKPCTPNAEMSLSAGVAASSSLLPGHVRGPVGTPADSPSLGESDAVKMSKSAGYQQDLQQLDKNLKQALGRPKPSDGGLTSDQKDASGKERNLSNDKPTVDPEKHPDDGRRHSVIDPAAISSFNESRAHVLESARGHRPRVFSGTVNVADASALGLKTNIPCEAGKQVSAAGKARPVPGIQVKDRFTVIPLCSDMVVPMKGTSANPQSSARPFGAAAQPSVTAPPSTAMTAAVQGGGRTRPEPRADAGGKRQAGTQTSIESPYSPPQMAPHGFSLPRAKQAHCGRCPSGRGTMSRRADYVGTYWPPDEQNISPPLKDQKTYSEDGVDFVVPQARRSVKIVAGPGGCPTYDPCSRTCDDQTGWSLPPCSHLLSDTRAPSAREPGDARQLDDGPPLLRCAECKSAVAADQAILQRRALEPRALYPYVGDDLASHVHRCRLTRMQQSNFAEVSRMPDQAPCRSNGVPHPISVTPVVSCRCGRRYDERLADIVQAEADEAHVCPSNVPANYVAAFLDASDRRSSGYVFAYPRCPHGVNGQFNGDQFGCFLPADYGHPDVPTASSYSSQRGFPQPAAGGNGALTRTLLQHEGRTASQQPSWRSAYDLIDRQRHELFCLLSGHRQQIDGLLQALSANFSVDNRNVPNCLCMDQRRRLLHAGRRRQRQFGRDYRTPGASDGTCLANPCGRHCIGCLSNEEHFRLNDENAISQEVCDENELRQPRHCFSQIQRQCENVDSDTFGLCYDRCFHRRSVQPKDCASCDGRDAH